MKALSRLTALLISSLAFLLLPSALLAHASVGAEDDQRLAGYEVYAETSALQLLVNEANAQVAVREKRTGDIWFTNPQDVDQQERIAKGALKDRIKAQLSMSYYTPRDQLITLDSYNDAVKYGQFSVTQIQDGVRIEYTLGREWNDADYLPVMISQKSFERNILSVIGDSNLDLFLRCCDLVQMVPVSEEYPSIDVFNLDSSVFGNYTLTAVGKSLTERNRKTLIENFVDQLVSSRSDLEGRSDIRSSHIPALMREQPVYVLNSRARRWDLDDMIAVLKETGLSPVELRCDDELLGLDAPKAASIVFRIALEYRLEGDCLVVTVPMSDIEYPTGVVNEFGQKETYHLYSINLLEYFGAAGEEAQGYILVPDGSGALINLNSGKAASAYQQWVYGRDNSLDPPATLLTKTEQVYLPVFGLKNGDRSFFSIIEDGQTMALINASVAGVYDSYNKVYASYVILPKGTASLRGATSFRVEANATRNQVNVYQPRKPASDIVVRYAFLHGEDSDYSGMARYYQKYLVKTGELDRLDMSGGVPLVLDLVGAIDVRTPVLGAPRDIVVPLTTFRQAASIVDELVDSGIARIDVRYSRWMKGGLRHVLPSGVAVERSLGTKRDLEDLADKLSSMGIGFYPDVSFLRVYRDTWFDGFTWLRDAARMLNRSASRVSGYDTVTGELLTDLISSPYVLSARRLGDLVTSFAREYARYSIPGLSLRDMASQVDSDFRTDEDLLIDRAQSLKIVEEQLRYLSDDVGLGLMASGANDYAIKYCDIVTDVPTGSSGYQILDETVPFSRWCSMGMLRMRSSRQTWPLIPCKPC